MDASINKIAREKLSYKCLQEHDSGSIGDVDQCAVGYCIIN